MSLHQDICTIDEMERKWAEVAKPSLSDTLEVVGRLAEDLPRLLVELRRLDTENDRLRAALSKAVLAIHTTVNRPMGIVPEIAVEVWKLAEELIPSPEPRPENDPR